MMNNDVDRARAGRGWLMENAGSVIRWVLDGDTALEGRLLENEEVAYWFILLAARVREENLSDIHGSHDYRYENIVGKCAVLGLGRRLDWFDSAMRFFLDALSRELDARDEGPLTFARMYRHRDRETALACYLPLLGYADDPAVRHVAHKRIALLHDFARQGRYDIYAKGPLPGVKPAWRPYVVDPALYADGNIRIPSMHDFILMAGIYDTLDADTRAKVDTVVRWTMDTRHAALHANLYFYAPDDPSYKAKSIDSKVLWHDFDAADGGRDTLPALLFHLFIFGRFDCVRTSAWYARAMAYLEGFRDADGLYAFPREMIQERRDAYVWRGGHMNVGEDRRSRGYARVLSTFWMERVCGTSF